MIEAGGLKREQIKPLIQHFPTAIPVEEEEEFVEEIDVPYREMTLRDYVAITYKIPVSNRAWLNEIIKREIDTTTFQNLGSR